MEKDVQKHFKGTHEKNDGKTKESDVVLMRGPTVEMLLKISDDQHHKETQTEQLPKEATEPTENQDPLGDIPTGEQSSDHPNTPITLICNEMLDGKTDEGALSDSDLVIVTKTDSNVPTEGDVFCCEYCAFMASSEVQVISHITASHEHMFINFKKLNRATCDYPKEHVGCMFCSEVGSEVKIRQHHMEKHKGQALYMYRFQCALCPQRKCFLKFMGLKVHFNRLHPGCQMKYTSLYGGAAGPKTSGLKTYKCSVCPYVRNLKTGAVNNVRQHVKQHFKSFMCGICRSTRYRTRSDVLVHYAKGHPETTDQQVVQDLQMMDAYNTAITDIIASATEVSMEKVLKNTARKSTSAPQLSNSTQEYSYYGNRPEEVDLSKIMTSVEINGMHLDMSAEKLSKIFDLNVVVAIEDCNLSVNLSSMFDS